MPTTFTTNAALGLQATGENSGTWGALLNSLDFTILDAVLGNVQTLTLAGTDITVSTPQTQVATIVLTGTLSANLNVIFPAIGRTFFVINQTSGAFTATLKITGGLATAISPQGTGQFFVLDGVNVYRGNTAAGIGTLVAASTADLGLAATSDVIVTGNTTITSFGSTATKGSKITVLFTGTPQITYNATSMLIPGQAPLFIQSGDVIEALALGSGNWQIIDVTRSSVAPNTGAGLSGGFRNLKITATGATTATITADGMTLFNSAGNAAYVSAVNVTNTNSGNGANGLDVGSIALSTWYFAFIIFNPTTQTVASLVSLSSTAPTLPAGYTYWLRVGALRNAASGGYWRTVQYGRRVTTTIGTTPTTVPLIAVGPQGSTGTPTWVAFSVAALVPPTASAIFVSMTLAGATTGIVAPSNAYGVFGSSTLPPPIAAGSGGGSPVAFTVSGWLTLESASIYCALDGSGDRVFTSAWEDNL